MLAGRRFRANPGYEPVLFDRLPPAERSRFALLERAPDLYGVLRPRGPGLAAKSITREAALLFFTLAEAGELPRYLDGALGAERDALVARLVMDGVLEVEAGGRFVSGPAAHSLLDLGGEAEEAGRLARLSLDALRYAATLRVDDPVALSNRLYGYNRLPLTGRWASAFGSEAAVAAILGLDDPRAHHGALADRWRAAAPSAASSGWHVWTRRAADRRTAGRLSHKLYVSPRSDWIGPAFAATVDALTASEAISFKVGRDAPGLLRPDKLVVYFDRREALDAAAGELQRRLAGVPAQGVPFTAAVDDEGLLSWGMDPPRGHVLTPWERPSWRLWVTDRLAASLLQARAAPDGEVEPWRFALDRLALEGVDRSTWAPREALWSSA